MTMHRYQSHVAWQGSTAVACAGYDGRFAPLPARAGRAATQRPTPPSVATLPCTSRSSCYWPRELLPAAVVPGTGRPGAAVPPVEAVLGRAATWYRERAERDN